MDVGPEILGRLLQPEIEGDDRCAGPWSREHDAVVGQRQETCTNVLGARHGDCAPTRRSPEGTVACNA